MLIILHDRQITSVVVVVTVIPLNVIWTDFKVNLYVTIRNIPSSVIPLSIKYSTQIYITELGLRNNIPFPEYSFKCYAIKWGPL